MLPIQRKSGCRSRRARERHPSEPVKISALLPALGQPFQVSEDGEELPAKSGRNREVRSTKIERHVDRLGTFERRRKSSSAVSIYAEIHVPESVLHGNFEGKDAF